jgi:hypothetical protein
MSAFYPLRTLGLQLACVRRRDVYRCVAGKLAQIRRWTSAHSERPSKAFRSGGEGILQNGGRD